MSPLWTAQELSEATGGTLTRDFAANGVSIDTRTVAAGDLFVALRGENRDGHGFVPDALRARAAGAMVHRPVPGAQPLLLVDDTLAALSRLGGFARARFQGQLIAVTGSVGKTTTKEMLRTILSVFGSTHAAVASYNNHWGVPLTLARMKRGTQFAVAEIGMNHQGEIAPLSRLARPHVAVVTAVEKAHIGYLGSIEAIADEKASIARGLEPGGIAVLPADSPLFPRLRDGAGDAKPITFGTGAAADVRLMSQEPDANGSVLLVEVMGRELRLRLNAPGRHMATNALAALAATAALGLDAGAAAGALESFVPLLGRGARRKIALVGGNALLLDESYNGNGASMRAALDVLRLQPATRRIAVLGDMLELGGEGPAEHAALAVEIVRSADKLFACGPLMRHLYEAVPQSLRAAHAETAADLAPIVAESVAAGDAILVKGSLGSRMKHVVDALDGLAGPKAGAA